MIKINLVSKRIPKEYLVIQKQFMVLLLLLLVAVFADVMWAKTVLSNKASVQDELDKAMTEKKRLTVVTAKSNKLKAKAKRRDDILKAIEVLEEKKLGPRPFMEYLTDILPSDIWLNAISEKDKTISVKGFSFSPQAVATLMRSMESSKHFSEVELAEVQHRIVNDEKIKTFTITAYWGERPVEPSEEELKKGKK